MEVQQYDSLKARIYDGYFAGTEGDVAFYVDQARKAKGNVLELGCGTGRITIPIADAGVHITGLDNSDDMLALARHKLASAPAAVKRRVQFVNADMRDFELGRQFKLVIVPYRTFMHLLAPEDQIQTLLSIGKHLAIGGRLVFNVFDPSAELLQGAANNPALQLDTEFVNPATGGRVVAWYSRHYDIAHQWIHQRIIFDDLDDEGRVLAQHYTRLDLRYSHRFELHYLLEMCGFQVDDLFGDFQGAPFSGSEQIWITHWAGHRAAV